VQAGNQGDGGIAAVAEFLGLEGSQPTALLFIESTHQEDKVGVPRVVRVVGTALALGALASMHRRISHDNISAAVVLNKRQTLYGKPWKYFADAA
jgi:hypothetical protein